MDIINGEDTNTCCSTKKSNTSNEDRDFFNDLPDPILVNILSFLPTIDLIQTLLIRRFYYLWQDVPVLDINSCSYHYCDDEACCQIVENEMFLHTLEYILRHHNSVYLDKVRFKFCFELIYSNDDSLIGVLNPYTRLVVSLEEFAVVLIGKLIDYSLNKKVKVLDLDFKGCGSVLRGEQYTFPDVLDSGYLIDLRLVACDIRLCRTINLKSLKVLVLDDVSLSDWVIAGALVGCPFLEDLSLIRCYGLCNLECKNTNLKKMVLDLKEDANLTVSCRYVLSLEIYGWIERVILLDVSSVADASIFFSTGFKYEERAYMEFRGLLLKLSQCKTFNPCTWSILVLSIWSFKNMPCPSFGWKHLTIKLSLSKWHHPGLSLLFRNSQSLETLTMYIYPGPTETIPRRESEWIQAYDFDGENYWDSQEATLPHLESIMICGYIDEPYVIQMVKFLLRSAKKLQKLVISTKGSFKTDVGNSCYDGPIRRQRAHFTSELLLELSHKFQDLPRASPDAVIHFS